MSRICMNSIKLKNNWISLCPKSFGVASFSIRTQHRHARFMWMNISGMTKQALRREPRWSSSQPPSKDRSWIVPVNTRSDTMLFWTLMPITWMIANTTSGRAWDVEGNSKFSKQKRVHARVLRIAVTTLIKPIPSMTSDHSVVSFPLTRLMM